MNAEWMLRAAAAAALFACAAVVAERVVAAYAGSRRWVWVAAMAGSLVVPILAWYAPSLIPHSSAFNRATTRAASLITPRAQALPVYRVTLMAPDQRAATPVTVELPGSVVQAAWPLVSFAFLACVLAAYVRLRRVRARAYPMNIDGCSVRISERTGPAVVGYAHPTIVVPRWVADATAAERSVIVLHEREHIDARDHWLMAGGTLALVAMPWNVALWWQYTRLRLAIETDCDARVVARGTDRELYGRTLIRSAGFVRTPSLLAPALGDPVWHLRRRILAMTARPPRARLVRTASYALIASALVVVACESTATELRAGAGHRAQPGPAPTLATPPAAASHEAWSQRVASMRVHVEGYTRPQLRARVTLISAGGRLVLLNGARVLRSQGDTIVDVVTPAEFRVDGASVYSVVGAAMESGTEVSVDVGSSQNPAHWSGAGARGIAPMVTTESDGMTSIPGNNTKAVENATARARRVVRAHLDSLAANTPSARKNILVTGDATGRMEPLPPSALPSSVVSTPAAAPPLPVDGGVQPSRALKPGQILIESASGAPILVRVDVAGFGAFNLRARAISVDKSSAMSSVTTPATLDIPQDREYAVRFVAVDSTSMLRISATGGEGYGFTSLTGLYAGAAIVCRSPTGAGIGGAGNSSTWSSPPKCAW